MQRLVAMSWLLANSDSDFDYYLIFDILILVIGKSMQDHKMSHAVTCDRKVLMLWNGTTCSM